jgi:putative ABC transport system substrate-binding protein
VSSACALLPSGTPAQIPRIGYGSYGPREAFTRDWIDPFLEGLRALGYVEGETIAIDWRFTRDQSNEEFHRVAAELVGLSPDVIVSGNAQGIALELKRATTRIPIVAYLLRAVESGFVADLAHPGGNLTGPAGDVPGSFVKPLDLLRDVVPGLAQVVILVDGRAVFNNVGPISGWELFRTEAEEAGLQAERVDVLSADDVEAIFETPAMQRAQAFYCAANGPLQPVAARLAELAIQHRVAGMTNDVFGFVHAGLLMSYGPSVAPISRRVAVYVDKILKGANPRDLPVEQPAVFDLAINVKTLRALGLWIPPSVAPLVTEWVQ